MKIDKKHMGIKVFISYFIFLLLFILLCQDFRAENDTVIVGIYNMNYFQSIQEDGSVSGYFIDYLNKLAEYKNLKYHYVKCDSWEDAVSRLEAGEIDLLAPMQHSKQRENKMIFSSYPLGTDTAMLYVRDKDDRFYLDDFSHFNHMKIALVKGSQKSETFREYAKKKKLDFTYREYATDEECFQALDTSEVDGVATGGLLGMTQYRVVAEYSIEPYYIAVTPKKTELMNIINDALSQIALKEYNFQGMLYRKYYLKAAQLAPISFTREESEYIKAHPVISVGFIPERAPFSYLENGEERGIVYEIMNNITKKCGIEMECANSEIGQNTMDYLQKNPDIIYAGIAVDNIAFQNDKYIVSNQFYTDQVGVVCKKGSVYNLDAPEGSYRLAISKSYSALKSFIESQYPQFEVIKGNSTEECLKMLEKGQVEFVAQNATLLNRFLDNPHYENLSMLPNYLTEEKMGVVALRTEDNETMIHIINKCAASITDQELSQYTVDYTITCGYHQSFKDLIYKYRYPLGAMAVMFIFTMLLFYKSFPDGLFHGKI